MTGLLLILVAALGLAVALSLKSLTDRTLIARLLRQAQHRLETADRPGAMRLLIRILALDRGHPKASWLLAGLYADSGQLVHAEMTLRDILLAGRATSDPDETDVRLKLAEIYERRGEYRKAAGEYFLLRKASHLPVEAAIRAGRLSLDQHRLREAELFLQDARRRDPRNPEVRFLLGRLELERLSPLAAQEHLEAALEAAWRPDETRLLLAQALLLRNHPKEALAHLRNLSPRTFVSATAEDLIARCLASLEGDPETVSDLERLAQDLEPLNSPILPAVLYGLACGRESQGRLDEALALWQRTSGEFGHQPSREKLAYYAGPGQDPRIRHFLTCGTDRWIGLCSLLTDTLGLHPESPAEVSAGGRTLDWICRDLKSPHAYHRTLLHIRRDTSALTVAETESLLRRREHLRTRDLLVITPVAHADAASWCELHGVFLRLLEEFADTLPRPDV